MRHDAVGDDETLYRSVRSEYAKQDADGTWRFSAEAFSDRSGQPSVDRAHLRGYDPAASRIGRSDAVASLVAQEVRSITCIVERLDNQQDRLYVLDVIADPVLNDPVLPDNPAHAKIVADRPLHNNGFKKLKQILSQLARLELPPA